VRPGWILTHMSVCRRHLRRKPMFLIFSSKRTIMLNNDRYQNDNIGAEMLNCCYGTRILIVLVQESHFTNRHQ
jgi:hypothetical protein